MIEILSVGFTAVALAGGLGALTLLALVGRAPKQPNRSTNDA